MSTNPPRARESRFGRRHPASPPPTPAAETDPATTSTAPEAGPRHRQLGQVLPIFAVMSVVLLGGTALLSDVGWWWTNQQHMQRAADAGALAGAIYLPGNQGRAFSSAIAEAAKNGYVDGEAGVVVTPRRDPDDPRKLLVDIDGPVNTNFAGVFCWQGGPCLRSVDVGVTGAASYVLPVPMGSPQNYYGVGFFQGVIPGTATARVLDVPDPTGGTLATPGVLGRHLHRGGVRENGDRYAPVHIGANNPPDGTNGGPNPDYDADGHDYTIEVGDGGQVRLFDPIFCATGRNLSGGWFGAGDHWTTDGTGGGETVGPVAVRFTSVRHERDALRRRRRHRRRAAPSSTTRGPARSATSRATSTSPGVRPRTTVEQTRSTAPPMPAHNQWVLPSGWDGLPAGTYRLNVNTNLGQNAYHGAENLFSIWVSGSGRARVYGGGRMAAYTNLDDTGVGGTQKFYFSQIEAVHAGKTMVITLFDPGEASKRLIPSLPLAGGRDLSLRHLQLVVERRSLGIGHAGPDRVVIVRGALQQPDPDDRDPAGHVVRQGWPRPRWPGRGRLVEGRVRRSCRQRHDHLGGLDPGQPGTPGLGVGPVPGDGTAQGNVDFLSEAVKTTAIVLMEPRYDAGLRRMSSDPGGAWPSAYVLWRNPNGVAKAVDRDR